MIKIRYYYSPAYRLIINKSGILVEPNGNINIKYGLLDNRNIVEKRFPRLTICSAYDTETDIMSFGISICSDKDIFVKEIGRKLAHKRALTAPMLQVKVSDEFSRISECSKHYAPIIERRFFMKVANSFKLKSL